MLKSKNKSLDKSMDYVSSSNPESTTTLLELSSSSTSRSHHKEVEVTKVQKSLSSRNKKETITRSKDDKQRVSFKGKSNMTITSEISRTGIHVYESESDTSSDDSDDYSSRHRRRHSKSHRSRSSSRRSRSRKYSPDRHKRDRNESKKKIPYYTDPKREQERKENLDRVRRDRKLGHKDYDNERRRSESRSRRYESAAGSSNIVQQLVPVGVIINPADYMYHAGADAMWMPSPQMPQYYSQIPAPQMQMRPMPMSGYYRPHVDYRPMFAPMMNTTVARMPTRMANPQRFPRFPAQYPSQYPSQSPSQYHQNYSRY